MPIKRGHVAPQNTYIDNLIQKFDSQGRKFLIANAVLPQNPIIFCNDELCYLCGYTRAEIIRRSAGLEFLYGPLTSSKAIHQLKHALSACEERSIVTILYNKSGDHFVCQINVAPVRNAEGQVRLYILTIRANSDFDKTRKPANGCGNRDAALVSNCRRFLGLSQLLASIGLRDRHYGANRENTGARLSVNRINERSLDETATDSSEDDSDRSIFDFQVSSLPVQPKTPSHRHHASLGKLSRPGGGEETPVSEDTAEPPVSPGPSRSAPAASSTPRESHHGVRQAATMPRPQLVSLLSSRPESALSHCIVAGPGGIVVNTDSQTQTRRNVSEKVAEMLSLGPEVNPDHKLHAPRVHPFTLIHYGPGKAVWDWLILFLVIYTAVVTPFSVAFLLNKKTQNHNFWIKLSSGRIEPLAIIDAFVDIMFIIDIVINFRTTYVNKNDELVSHPCRIAVHYMKGWLIIDVVAAIPFEFLYFGENSDDMIMLVGLMKTARLLRLVRVVRKLDRYSEYGAGLLFLLMLTFILIAHWLACVWYAVGNMEHENRITTGWLDTLAVQIRQPFSDDSGEGGGPSTKAKYITALYFTFSSLTSVGFGNVSPNTDPEKLFSIFVMLLGSLMYAGIFGHVSAVIQRLYSGTARYHSQMLRVKEFIRFHQIPNPLKHRLEEFFQHAWSYTNGIDMNLVLRSFPECLQADICLHLNRNLLNRSIPFKGANQGCLRSLALKLKTTHVPPGDTLLHRGDILCFIYFIARGSVEILMGHELVAVLCQGDVFGESPFDRDVIGQSRYYVRTLTYCDLHKIQQEDILETLDMYPEFGKQFRRNLEITFDLSEPFKVATTTGRERTSKPQVAHSTASTGGLGEGEAARLVAARVSTSHRESTPVRRASLDVYQVHWATNATESASSSMSFIDAIDQDCTDPTEQDDNHQHSQRWQETVPTSEHRYQLPSSDESVRRPCVDCHTDSHLDLQTGRGRCEQGENAEAAGSIWSTASTLYGRLTNVEKHINQFENKLETDLTQILHLIRSHSASAKQRK